MQILRLQNNSFDWATSLMAAHIGQEKGSKKLLPKKQEKQIDKKPTSDLVRAPFLLRARTPSFTAAAETAAFSLFL